MKTKKAAAYVRVSTEEQSKGLEAQERAIYNYLEQHDMLNRVVWFRDRVSGKDMERPAWKKLKREIFLGNIDCVVVWRLDRLSRSLKDGVNTLSELIDKRVRCVSVSEQLDFSGPAGELIAAVLFAVAKMGRETLRENTRNGLAKARARGVVLGKRRRIMPEDIRALQTSGKSVSEISRMLSCSRTAIYRALKLEKTP